ncbi:uncharacterized protein RCC_08619 [Ramularia collo-cygni]|uniref:Tetraspanin Tsp3 n=1 Tax=Ramularia collo-cygni TaxID=112498 RepID=A0A2D3VD05_9PEZI|nr:uncharacterized protein RCC_08619 [Ramularia collo-cygni]CZT22912.1 uncharacterized protein RCC_08619 [Ramularia collo-cygni]
MAKFTKRQLLTTLSLVYLIALTFLAAYALHQTHKYSLPIPTILSALTVALPPLAGITLETLVSFQYQLASKKGATQTSKIFQFVNGAFLIYETILATLAGTHIYPIGGLLCPLHDKWQDLFSKKDSGRIRQIQNAFQCCGFSTTKEMAWPFPGNGRGADACVVRYAERAGKACLGSWRDMERKVAIILMVVPLGVFLWKVALFLLSSSFDTAWLPSTVRLPEDQNRAGNRSAIAYRDVEDQGEADSLRDEVTRLNNDSDLAYRVEGGRIVRPSPLFQESGVWNEE